MTISSISCDLTPCSLVHSPTSELPYRLTLHTRICKWRHHIPPHGVIFYQTTRHHNPDNVTANWYSTEGKPILVKHPVEFLFCPTPPDFLKGTTCWKVPRLWPFDLATTCTCRRVRNISRMTLTGENRRARKKPCPSACPPNISHGMIWDRTRTSVVTGRRPTAKAMARHLKTTINLKVSPYRAVNTLRIGYKNQPVNAV
jgi:hypothetical protein